MVNNMTNSHWENVICNLCKGKDYRILFKSTYDPEIVEKKFAQYSVYTDIVKCTKCGFVYETPREKADIITKRLRMESYPIKEHAIEERALSFKKYIDSMKKNIPFQGKLLDLGCNIGDFLHLAKKEGVEIYGIEPSVFAAEKAMNLFGIKVINDLVDNAVMNLPDDFFDIVTLWDVIEHFLDPLDILCKVNKKMKKGAYICIATHNIDSQFSKITGSWYPHLMYQHFYHFSDKTIKEMSSRAGYEVVKIEVFNKMWSIRFLLGLLKEFFPRNRFLCSISDIGINLVTFLRIQNIIITIPVYNDMRVYARRKN